MNKYLVNLSFSAYPFSRTNLNWFIKVIEMSLFCSFIIMCSYLYIFRTTSSSSTSPSTPTASSCKLPKQIWWDVELYWRNWKRGSPYLCWQQDGTRKIEKKYNFIDILFALLLPFKGILLSLFHRFYWFLITLWLVLIIVWFLVILSLESFKA